jgi:spore coat protein A, manganese oxidase
MMGAVSTRPRHAWAVALLLTAGLVVWWLAVPPKVLGGDPPSGIRDVAVAVLLTLPLALLAVGVATWATRRYTRPTTTRRRLVQQAGATAALFAALLLVTAPLRLAMQDEFQTPDEPNLAAIHYENPAVEANHHAMMQRDGVPAAEIAAMSDPSTGNGPDTVAFAVQDASLALLVALPLALLGLYLVAQFGEAPAHRRRTVLMQVRSRWAPAAGTAVLLVSGNLVLAPSASAAVVPFSQPLKIPPVLQGSSVTIQMRQADVQIMPSGPPTRMWTFNGSFPGPTIRRPSGTTTRVTFRNDLPASFGDATIHHHGSHSRSTEDGQPNSQLIPPGGLRTYSYEHVEAGRPERAVTQWYHDHRMGLTGRNVWNGLAGFFILDDRFDSALPLPKGEFDVPLMIVDRTFDANNQIPYTVNLDPGVQGDTFLVNGVPQPYFNVGDRKYRFRVLNASNRTPLVLSLSNGAPLTQIATDSGLLPAPVTKPTILLQPAERVEVVVDFAGMLGQTVNLVNANPAGIPPPEFMQFRVNRDLTETSSVPATLRPAPTFPAPVQQRQFVINRETDAAGTTVGWDFNGQQFDSNRFDAQPRLNTTEEWTFLNPTNQPHAIHIHDVDWRLTRRFNLATDAAGNPIPGDPLAIDPAENGLKETWSIPANTGFSVRTTFTDRLGPYVFHCHMLEHEDFALMAQFNVVP